MPAIHIMPILEINIIPYGFPKFTESLAREFEIGFVRQNIPETFVNLQMSEPHPDRLLGRRHEIGPVAIGITGRYEAQPGPRSRFRDPFRVEG